MKLYTAPKEIDELIKETIEALADHYPGVSTWVPEWYWSNRMTTTLGVALTHSNPYKEEIRFSSSLWKIATPEIRRNNIIHETCHIMNKRHNRSAKSHGPEWKAMMRLMGEEPSVKHSLPTPSVTLACACPEGCRTSVGRYRRLKRGTSSYICRKCRTTLTGEEL